MIGKDRVKSKQDKDAKEEKVEGVSTMYVVNKGERKKKTTEKIKELKQKIEQKIRTKGMKQKKKKSEEEIEIKAGKEYLIDLQTYIKAKIHVAHKIITPDMKQYVFKRKADGVAVFNTEVIDQKLREAIEYISQFKPENIIVVGKKPACWKALEKFNEFTNITIFKRYPPGILTNPQLSDFIQPDLVIIVDPIADKNALHDANIARIPIFALCNSNHYTKGIDFVLPVNNKDETAIALVFYILAKGYLKKKGIQKEIQPEDFINIKQLNENEK